MRDMSCQVLHGLAFMHEHGELVITGSVHDELVITRSVQRSWLVESKSALSVSDRTTVMMCVS